MVLKMPVEVLMIKIFLIKKQMMLLFFFIILCQETKVHAQNDLQLNDDFSQTKKVEPKTHQDKSFFNQTKNLRIQKKYFIYGTYSPIDLLIPSKYGLTFGLNQNQNISWEFEFVKGTFSIPAIIQDLGKMTDTRYSLIRRSYMGNNSFNISYGLTLFSFSIKLGDDLLNRLNSNYPSVDLLELESLGFNIGVGNRWNFNENFSLSVDWFSWSQPVFVTKDRSKFLDYTSNEGDRDDVEKAKKYISYFPRLAFLKLQMGYLF